MANYYCKEPDGDHVDVSLATVLDALLLRVRTDYNFRVGPSEARMLCQMYGDRMFEALRDQDFDFAKFLDQPFDTATEYFSELRAKGEALLDSEEWGPGMLFSNGDISPKLRQRIVKCVRDNEVTEIGLLMKLADENRAHVLELLGTMMMEGHVEVAVDGKLMVTED